MNQTKPGQGHFFVAKYRRVLDIVEPNTAKMTIFVPGYPKRFMVTTRLKPCSVVMIVSRFAAIMAIVPPQAPHTSYSQYSRDVRTMMEWVNIIYSRNRRDYFQPERTQTWCWIVTPVDALSGQLFPGTQQVLMWRFLTDMGLGPSVRHYDIIPEHHTLEEGENVVCIDGRRSGSTTND
ncbi:hypothetical protein BDV97DRAFT_364988 [Delphinella strobiligena]|nr:hypothetical protein BDV97DRAFT_364988 [Delphinella strobiligena]